MASDSLVKQPPIGVALLVLGAIIVLGILISQWVTTLVVTIVQIAMVLVALIVMAWVAKYLLRKGRPAGS